VILTAAVSTSIVAGFYIIDLVTGGALVGRYRLPVALYVLLFVNVDFWESFWVATHRTARVFIYSAARLLVRMLVVVGVAVLTNDVATIIWSLIVLEGVRLIAFAGVWSVMDRAAQEPPIENIRRDQLQFCVPVGLAALLYMISRNLGNIVVVKWLGAAALAQMTIGTYGEPVILALRNSISTAMLPELVRRGARSDEAPLQLWRRTTVVNCVLLFPSVVLLAWFAEPLVFKVFGLSYRAAVPVLQVYTLVILAACFDFSPPLRAINKTRPLVTSNLVAAIASGIALIFLVPVAGLVGATLALVVAGFVEDIYRAWAVGKLYGVTLRKLLPWMRTAQVALCAVVAALPVVAVTWGGRGGMAGVIFGSLFYLALFAALLMAIGVEEAITLARRVRATLTVAAFGGR